MHKFIAFLAQLHTGKCMDCIINTAVARNKAAQHSTVGGILLQDAYLQQELAGKNDVDAERLEEIEPHISLWQGDITALKVDAIVAKLGVRLPGNGKAVFFREVYS